MTDQTNEETVTTELLEAHVLPAATPAVLQEVAQPATVIVPADQLVNDAGMPAAVSIVLPPDWSQHQVPTAEIVKAVLPAPHRQSGTLEVENAESFTELVEDRQLSGNRPTVFARQRDRSLTAVLNGAHGDEAGFGDYRVVCKIERTPEWQAWLSGSGGFMSQSEFADFVEDHLPEFQKPSQADMLELAQTFTATRNMTYKRATSTQSGVVSLQCENTEAASAGRSGQLEIPERFTFAVQIFEGGDVVKVSARLRYRLDSEGQLFLGWRLDQPEEIERRLFDEIVGSVELSIGSSVIRGVAHA